MTSADFTVEERPGSLSVREALRTAAQRLRAAGIESAEIDGEALLRYLLGLDRANFFVRLEDKLGSEDEQAFRHLLERRAGREPLAYITGHKEFWSLDFLVTPAVLIPRPETELLVELGLGAARDLAPKNELKILDLGTGSGAIAIALATELAAASLWALDSSADALVVAAANAERHRVRERVNFLQGDLFDPLVEPRLKFDLVISNPPYIRRTELAGLEPEVTRFEPLGALDGGVDGLEYYRRIIGVGCDHLADGGRMLLEIGEAMSQSVVDLFESTVGYTRVSVHQDYSARDRVVAALKGPRRG